MTVVIRVDDAYFSGFTGVYPRLNANTTTECERALVYDGLDQRLPGLIQRIKRLTGADRVFTEAKDEP